MFVRKEFTPNFFFKPWLRRGEFKAQEENHDGQVCRKACKKCRSMQKSIQKCAAVCKSMQQEGNNVVKSARTLSSVVNY